MDNLRCSLNICSRQVDEPEVMEVLRLLGITQPCPAEVLSALVRYYEQATSPDCIPASEQALHLAYLSHCLRPQSHLRSQLGPDLRKLKLLSRGHTGWELWPACELHWPLAEQAGAEIQGDLARSGLAFVHEQVMRGWDPSHVRCPA